MSKKVFYFFVILPALKLFMISGSDFKIYMDFAIIITS